jgi:hypothetical protein
VGDKAKKGLKTIKARSTNQGRPDRTIEAAAKKYFASIAREYDITDAGGQAIIKMGEEALVAVWKAEAQVEREGMTVTDKFGQLKIHPLMPTIRDSRAQVLKALSMLHLDLEPLRDRAGRPPPFGGS